MKNILITLIIIITLSAAYSNRPIILKKDIIWQEQAYTYTPTPNDEIEIYSFDGANYESSHPTLPYFTTRFPVEGYGRLSVELIHAVYKPLDKKASKDDEFLNSDLKFISSVVKDRSDFFGQIRFIPIRKTANGKFEKLVSFELKINFTASSNFTFRGGNTFNSVLSDDNTYKIGIRKNGIHKMDYNFLKNELKVPIDGVDIKKIKIYGNGGGMLPEKISISRIDDLFENAIQVVDSNNDGKFNSGDYILFYAEEAGKWSLNSSTNLFRYQKNIYSDLNYYFIKISGENGKRLSTRTSLQSTNYTSNSFNDYIHFEEDKVNLLHKLPNQGSGKKWFGDHFEALREKDYNNIFTFPNLIQTEAVSFRVEFAGRSDVKTKFKITLNGQTFTSKPIASTTTSKQDGIYAYIQKIDQTFNASSDQIAVKI
ncbi:MAG TPA: hypothetical protein ENK52_07065, partial [Saprospiraceae bacterium]|nr:hypothetical protein [Saprospiraceae bacterium]